MPFSDVRHQPRAHRLLQRALAGDRLPHAYIFHGPDGVGKEMLATRLAKVLLCDRPREVSVGHSPEQAALANDFRDACDSCRSCHLVGVGNHPDLHLIYRQLNAHHPDPAVRSRKALDLGVDVMRHFVIDAVAVTPSCGRAKVFIIREADRITPQAQNAMLKTLEEPPRTTYLILLAASIDRLLGTTRSRCQPVEFSPLPAEFVAAKLSEIHPQVHAEDAKFYSVIAQGSLGAALHFVQDGIADFDRQLRQALMAHNRMEAPALARRVQEFVKESSVAYQKRDHDLSDTAAQRQALRTVLVLVAAWYRDQMHSLAGTPELAARPFAAVDAGSAPAGRLNLEAAAWAIKLAATTERQLDLNVNVQLCIESLMFKLAAIQEEPRSAASVAG